MLDLEKK